MNLDELIRCCVCKTYFFNQLLIVDLTDCVVFVPPLTSDTKTSCLSRVGFLQMWSLSDLLLLFLVLCLKRRGLMSAPAHVTVPSRGCRLIGPDSSSGTGC